MQHKITSLASTTLSPSIKIFWLLRTLMELQYSYFTVTENGDIIVLLMH